MRAFSDLYTRIQIKFGCSLPLCGWTDIGQKIQTLSKLYQIYVQTLSNTAKSTKSVQSLSNNFRPCPNSVKCLSRSCPNKVFWTDTGQENLGFVQTLSNDVEKEDTIYHCGQSGQTLDLDKC